MSLRDVDRVLTVMSWFYQQSQGHRMLYQLMDEKLYGEHNDSSSEDDIDEEDEVIRDMNVMRSKHKYNILVLPIIITDLFKNATQMVKLNSLSGFCETHIHVHTIYENSLWTEKVARTKNNTSLKIKKTQILKNKIAYLEPDTYNVFKYTDLCSMSVN